MIILQALPWNVGWMRAFHGLTEEYSRIRETGRELF